MPRAMKVTMQSSKDGFPTHNSRNFDLSLADHIDQERVSLNKYIAIYPELKDNFEEVEKKFYKETFSKWIDDTNEKAKKANHKERKKTSEKIRKMNRYKPDEIIYQLGDINNAPTPQQFQEWMQQVIAYHNKITKGYCPILNAAIHNDEYTPHAHIRQVWIYKDINKNGEKFLKIGKDKGLEAAGIPLPNPDKPNGKYNNRQVTYTKMMREEAERLAIEMGFQIDVNRSDRKHMSKDEYIKYLKEQGMKQVEHHYNRDEINKDNRINF